MFEELLLKPGDFSFHKAGLISYTLENYANIHRRQDYEPLTTANNEPWVVNLFNSYNGGGSFVSFESLKQAKQYVTNSFIETKQSKSSQKIIFVKQRSKYNVIPSSFPNYHKELANMLLIYPRQNFCWEIDKNIKQQIKDITGQSPPDTFKTRKETIQFLHAVLTKHLNLFYSKSKYLHVKQELSEQGFLTSSVQDWASWWIIFIPFHLELQHIL